MGVHEKYVSLCVWGGGGEGEILVINVDVHFYRKLTLPT